MRELVAIEPFCGAGGIALGLGDAGFAHAWAGELDKHAATTFRSMFPGVPVFNGKVDTGREADDAVAGREIDLLAGGVPCQPFSTAGLGQGEYDPRDGFPAFLRMTRHLRPRAFLIENVKGLTTRKHAAYFARVLEDLRAAGYAVGWRVLDAADYGVPQRRHRVFIVGLRRDVAEAGRRAGVRFVWPAPTHSIEALVAAKWVGAAYWGAHGFVGAPPHATQSKEEARVLRRLEAGDAASVARLSLARWRTVRDAIGDIAGHAVPGRTMHSAPVEVESATVALTTTTGDRRVSASGRQSASDLPSDAVQAAHAGHNGHPPVVGLEEAQCLTEQQQRIAGYEAASGVVTPRDLHPDYPARMVSGRNAGGDTNDMLRVDPAQLLSPEPGVVANHEPAAPVKASETRPEWLQKHPAAAADAPSPAVRTGHRDAETLVADAAELANHGPAPLSPLVQGRIDTGEVDVTLRKHPIRKLDTVSPAVESNLARGGYYGLVELDGLTVRNIGAGDGDGKRVDEPGPAVPAGSDGQRGLGVFDPSSRHAWTGGEGTTEPGRIHSRPAVMLRRLTVRECARLQDFPDSHVFSGPKTAAYRQVGNAAPRGLVRPVALAIAAFLRAVDESDVADLE